MQKTMLYEYRRPEWGRAFDRISDALHTHAPQDVAWTPHVHQADMAIAHIVGPGELFVVDDLLDSIPTVLIQHCYHTAMPAYANYPARWQRARLVVSFHQLPQYTEVPFEFLALPWGADPTVFKRTADTAIRPCKVMATGHMAGDECIDKVWEAAKRLNVVLYHTGENFGWSPDNYHYMEYMTSRKLCKQLNETQYVSALRVREGFELMAIEGLFCGARPIIPTEPTYDWYREHAITVDVNRADIVDQLVDVLKCAPTPISKQEHDTIVQKFSWPTLMGQFYTRLGL